MSSIPGLTGSSFVVLQAGFGAANAYGQPTVFLTRNMPDGSSAPFSIPPNQALVVTEVDWQFFGLFDDSHKPVLTGMQSVQFFLIGSASEPDSLPPSVPVLSFSIDLGSNGTVQGNLVMNTGFAMTGHGSLAFGLLNQPIEAMNRFGFMLRGYLIPA